MKTLEECFIAAQKPSKPPACEVVRLATNCFYTEKSGLVIQKSLRRMKRLSNGDWNSLQYDSEMAGADLAAKSITNLNQVKDGLYRLRMCNISRDFETGHIDDWKYELIPLTPHSCD